MLSFALLGWSCFFGPRFNPSIRSIYINRTPEHNPRSTTEGRKQSTFDTDQRKKGQRKGGERRDRENSSETKKWRISSATIRSRSSRRPSASSTRTAMVSLSLTFVSFRSVDFAESCFLVDSNLLGLGVELRDVRSIIQLDSCC